MRRITFWFCSIIAALILGCSQAANNYPSLIEQGILGLSATNPYLGPNIFLSGELEKSSFLYNFFKGRGAPSAIEIEQPHLSPTKMFLYYPVEKQVYIADFAEREYRHEWVVRGPYAIERNDYRTLMKIQTALEGEPVFLLWGRQFRFNFDKDQAVAKVLKPSLPEYTPTPVPPKPRVVKPKKELAIEVEKAAMPTPTPTMAPQQAGTALSSDQQALMIARGFAPRAENGDIVHIVRSADENLDAISKWYTGSNVSQAEIAQNNNLAPTATLRPGMKIKIPALLVRETRVMPAQQTAQ